MSPSGETAVCPSGRILVECSVLLCLFDQNVQIKLSATAPSCAMEHQTENLPVIAWAITAASDVRRTCRSPSGELRLGQLYLHYSSLAKMCVAERQRQHISDGISSAPCFVWSSVVLLGSRQRQPDYDIVLLSSIDAPVLLQPDPLKDGRWYHNQFFQVGSSPTGLWLSMGALCETLTAKPSASAAGYCATWEAPASVSPW